MDHVMEVKRIELDIIKKNTKSVGLVIEQKKVTVLNIEKLKIN